MTRTVLFCATVDYHFKAFHLPFPKKERATVAGIFDSGSKFGGAVAMPLIAWMIAVFDAEETAQKKRSGFLRK